MTRIHSHRRALLALIAATVALASAPRAEAGHGYGRYKHDRDRGCGDQRWVAESHACAPYPVAAGYCAEPVAAYAPPCALTVSGVSISFAGNLGGVAIGGLYQRALPAGYAYVDPYCGDHFVSLAQYSAHARYHHHPARARLVHLQRPLPESYRSWAMRSEGDHEH